MVDTPVVADTSATERSVTSSRGYVMPFSSACLASTLDVPVAETSQPDLT